VMKKIARSATNTPAKILISFSFICIILSGLKGRILCPC
jgi:hypothetical protein